jgi:hypothetical protein
MIEPSFCTMQSLIYRLWLRRRLPTSAREGLDLAFGNLYHADMSASPLCFCQDASSLEQSEDFLSFGLPSTAGMRRWLNPTSVVNGSSIGLPSSTSGFGGILQRVVFLAGHSVTAILVVTYFARLQLRGI